jgi:DNA polymerase III epsilon subunit-like protein
MSTSIVAAKEQIQRWYVDQRQSMAQIARRLAMPVQQVRAIAQEERWVWRPLRTFAQSQRGTLVMVLDLETSGLPRTQGFNRYFPYVDCSAYDSARIVQLAFTCFRIGESVTRDQIVSLFRRPDGFTISPEAQEITQLDTQWLDAHGQTIQAVLAPLLEALPRCTYILAHNAAFDINILKNELFRLGHSTHQIEDMWFPDHKVRCTCRLTDYTRLGVLHAWIPNPSSLAFHNAQDDVLALAEIINFLSLE